MPQPTPRRSNPHARQTGLSTLGAIVVLGMLTLAALAGCTTLESLVAGPTITPTPQRGTPVEPPIDLPDLTLTNQAGEPFRLSDLQGKLALFYFGYTHCPDACPLTLATYRQIADALGEDAEQVAFVFVSVDGGRDTPERMATYLSAFSPDFIGLTTEDETALQEATDAFGVYYELEEVAETQVDYLVAHTTSVFLVNQQGQLTTVYAYRTPPEVIVEDIQRMLEQG